MKKSTSILFWAVRIVAALIMLQTLYFKFTGAEESIYIFTQVRMEPFGRIGVGIMELIASALILIPATVWAGAALALGLMGGAIMMHLTLLGIEVQGDGGQLFLYAVIVAVCSLIAFWLSRKSIPEPIRKFLPSFLQ
ncbi:MAG: DoxX family protein [Cyclobacteriaceae bacterium]